MKVLGFCHKDKFIFSRARHDYRTYKDMFVDGGQPWTSASYCRTNSNRMVWAEIKGITADILVNDWNLGTDNYGIESIKNIKIIPRSKWPKLNSIKWKVENAVWGVFNPETHLIEYKLLKNLTTEHLKAILETQSVSADYKKIISNIISKKSKEKTSHAHS